MKHATDIHVELIKLVDGLSCAHIPQHTIIQHKVICWVEGGTVPLVVVSQVCVVEDKSNLTCLDVINLAKTSTEWVFNNLTANLNILHIIMIYLYNIYICGLNCYTYTCYMFLCPDDTILWELTEFHIVVPQKGMPMYNKSNILKFTVKH